MISVDDSNFHSSETSVQAIKLDIRLSPSVADRLPFLRWVFLVFGVVCLLVGLAFMSLGARPVLGFMGLEVVLLFTVYKYCEGNARQHEHVTVSEQHFIVRTTDRYGRLSLARFDPRWTVLRLSSHEMGGGLVVSSMGRSRRFGDFLNLVECNKVLSLLHHALQKSPGG